MIRELLDWYGGRRVVVTGHTGFKGAWLATWLREAGATVTGYALAPDSGRPSLFEAGDVASGITSVIGDLRDSARLTATLAADPEIIFHLAAQSLVRRSYREPIATLATNVMGTANLLGVARSLPSLRAVVSVTSDKCYENDGTGTAYREEHAMGGHDLYSARKGCAELVTSAYRRSFLAALGVAVASARAGNVIGGGDWAEDRLIPELLGAAVRDEPAVIRNPDATRPWQFVLEPLRAYLMLGRALVERGAEFAQGWNFGPRTDDALQVRDLAHRMGATWDRVRITEATEPADLHEARVLVLDCSKARDRLGWSPALTLNDAVAMTVTWYRAWDADPSGVPALMRRQLQDYESPVLGSGGIT